MQERPICIFCGEGIPEDEKAVPDLNGSSAHFSCVYTIFEPCPFWEAMKKRRLEEE